MKLITMTNHMLIKLLLLIIPIASAIPAASPSGSRPIILSESKGGSGGKPFSDFLPGDNGLAVITKVNSIKISSDDHLRAIQITYSLSNGSLYIAPNHGDNKSSTITLTFDSDEFIEGIKGKTSGHGIDQITIYTRKLNNHEKRIYGPYGKAGDSKFSLKGRLLGIFGRAGDHLNSFGMYTLKGLNRGMHFGGNGSGDYRGDDFNENPDESFLTPVVKVTKIYISSEGGVNSIQFQYLLYGGKTQLGQIHGTVRGKMTVINVEKSEHLTGIEGKSDGLFINQLTFLTWRSDGSTAQYGPFGTTGSQPFSSYGNVMGLAGNAGNMLNGISVYYV